MLRPVRQAQCNCLAPVQKDAGAHGARVCVCAGTGKDAGVCNRKSFPKTQPRVKSAPSGTGPTGAAVLPRWTFAQGGKRTGHPPNAGPPKEMESNKKKARKRKRQKPTERSSRSACALHRTERGGAQARARAFGCQTKMTTASQHKIVGPILSDFDVVQKIQLFAVPLAERAKTQRQKTQKGNVHGKSKRLQPESTFECIRAHGSAERKHDQGTEACPD